MLFIYKYGNGLECICFYFCFLIFCFFFFSIQQRLKHAISILIFAFAIQHSCCCHGMIRYTHRLPAHSLSLSIFIFSISPMHTNANTHKYISAVHSRIDLSHWDLTKIQHTLSISLDVSERADRIACNHKKSLTIIIFTTTIFT